MQEITVHLIQSTTLGGALPKYCVVDNIKIDLDFYKQLQEQREKEGEMLIERHGQLHKVLFVSEIVVGEKDDKDYRIVTIIYNAWVESPLKMLYAKF